MTTTMTTAMRITTMTAKTTRPTHFCLRLSSGKSLKDPLPLPSILFLSLLMNVLSPTKDRTIAESSFALPGQIQPNPMPLIVKKKYREIVASQLEKSKQKFNLTEKVLAR